MDDELSRCGLDSSVSEVCLMYLCFVYVSGFWSGDDDSNGPYRDYRLTIPVISGKAGR